MAAVLLPRPRFVAAVVGRIAWLGEHRGEEQLDHFLSGLDSVRRRIEQQPEAGPPVKRSATHILRMRLFPRPLPYLVYYSHALTKPVTEVYLVRLYGSGQRHEGFDTSEWPW